MSSLNNETSNINLKDYKFKETPKFVKILVQFLKYAILVLACLLVIIPLLVVLIGAFKTHEEYVGTNVFTLPEVPQFENFKIAFINGKVLKGLFNTGIILLISCFGTIVTGTMTAFVLQRFSMVFTKLVKAVFLFAALLPNISMQVTVFQIVSKLNLYNSLAAPCILYIGTDIVSIYIFIQFLDNISISLDESAILDGASYFRVYWSIILPMLRPAIATVLVIKFVGIYNDFYTANLYMPSDDLAVVSTALYRFIGPYGAQWEVIFAGIIICIIPSLIIFLTLQKFIYSNLVAGSVKE
ncbi:MAG: carbohydrate ABC transporter permease [Ruminiclostridium sp.]|nr:carbohydrate ABC transporter permease [Ruminiclostridium sp.]MBQ8841088.1 carbohydrate ABC transporter permease [Ruminiclostridium sp.]